MKKYFLLLLWLLGSIFLTAQNRQLLYDFYEIPQTLLLNPGVKTPQKWHAGFPITSNISFYAGTTGITVGDLFTDDGIDFNEKFQSAVNTLDFRDNIGAGLQIELLYGGFRNTNRPSDYYSFGIYGEGYFINYWPQDLAILALEGNANNLNRRFDLNHLSARAEMVNVFHFGINRKLNRKWQVGARAKLYSSILEIKSTQNTGHFVTTQGANNSLRNTLVSDITIRTSGVETLFDALDDDAGETETVPSWLMGRSLFGGNLGFGMDFGFTHSIGQRTFLTGSIVDLGFIYHNNDVKNYTLQGAASNEGIEVILPQDAGNLDSNYWQELIDEIEELIPFETNEDAYLSMRPLQLNASIRHNWGQRNLKNDNCECGLSTQIRENDLDYLNAAGGHLHTIFRPRGPQPAITGFYQRRIGNFLAVRSSITADRYTLTNIGLGVNFQMGPVNLYFLGDNLLAYNNIASSHYASFQFGLNILSWNN